MTPHLARFIDALETYGSPPPHDIDVERAVLGGILTRADHLMAPEVVSLSADSFYRIAHGQLFMALRELHREGRPLDVITIRDAFGRERVEKCGGLIYISRLADGCPRSTNVPYYATIVGKHGANRKILARLQLAERRMCDGDTVQALALLRDLDDVTRRHRFTLLDDQGIAALPDTPYIIDKLLAAVAFGTLWAQTGVGKTTLLMRMLTHISSGLPLFGARVQQPGNLALIVTEGRGGLRARHDAAWAALKIPPDQRAGIHVVAEPIDLLRAEDVDELVAILKPISPVLLVIDGWARSLGEPDGDTGATVRAVQAVDRLREALGCTVLAAHHPGWDVTRERGSSHLRASVDFLWSLKTDGTDDRLILKCEKSRDAEPFQNIRLRRITMNDSVTVELADDPDDRPRLTGKQPDVLNALRDAATRAEWAKVCADSGISRATAYRNIDFLLRHGYVDQRHDQPALSEVRKCPTFLTHFSPLFLTILRHSHAVSHRVLRYFSPILIFCEFQFSHSLVPMRDQEWESTLRNNRDTTSWVCA